jgi:hypothetical protein
VSRKSFWKIESDFCMKEVSSRAAALKASSERWEDIKSKEYLEVSRRSQLKHDIKQEVNTAIQILIRVLSRIGIIFIALLSIYTLLQVPCFLSVVKSMAEFFQNLLKDPIKIALHEASKGKIISDKYIEMPFEILFLLFVFLFRVSIAKFINFFKKAD